MRAILELEQRSEKASPRGSALGLFWLVLVLAVCGAGLYASAGLPHLPELPRRLPTWQEVWTFANRSDLPVEDLARFFLTIGWALWLWMVASLFLELIGWGLEVLAHGAAWVTSFRWLTGLVTVPFVRRVVDGALVAIVVVNVAARAPRAMAAPESPSAVVRVVAHPADPFASPYSVSPDPAPPADARTATYVVQPGDNLWAIAERFYGTGEEYRRLVEANDGRRMPDGRHFDRGGVIYPDWRLAIPLPSRAVEEVDDQTLYTVEEGDTLRGIAARFLGDELRWPEIFELNEGTARLPGGRVLKDPDLIWPGLRLRLPLPPAERAEPRVEPPVAPAAQPQATKPEATMPAPQAPTVAPTVVSAPEPAPEPTAVPSEPTPVPTPAVVVEPPAAATTNPSETSPLLYAGAGLGAAVAVGGSAYLLRRRLARLRGGTEDDEVGDPVRMSAGFADAEFARSLVNRLLDGPAETVTIVCQHTLSFFEEQGMGDLAILMAREGRRSTTLTIRAGLADQARLVELAPELGRMLGGEGKAWMTIDHDVELRLSNVRLIGRTPRESSLADRLTLLPLAVLPRRERLFANWPEIGHVLVASQPGGGADVILTSLVSTIAAQVHPEEICLWTIAGSHSLPIRLRELPHQMDGFIDPSDDQEIGRVLRVLRGNLESRMDSPADTAGEAAPEELPVRRDRPGEILIVGELAELPIIGQIAEDLAFIAEHGARFGTQLLAATNRPADFSGELLHHFQTRLVLKMTSDEDSVALLGEPDAADLEGGGDLLARVEARRRLRACGYRVSPEQLDQFVRLLQEARGSLGRSNAARSANVATPSHVEAATGPDLANIDTVQEHERIPTLEVADRPNVGELGHRGAFPGDARGDTAREEPSLWSLGADSYEDTRGEGCGDVVGRLARGGPEDGDADKDEGEENLPRSMAESLESAERALREARSEDRPDEVSGEQSATDGVGVLGLSELVVADLSSEGVGHRNGHDDGHTEDRTAREPAALDREPDQVDGYGDQLLTERDGPFDSAGDREAEQVAPSAGEDEAELAGPEGSEPSGEDWPVVTIKCFGEPRVVAGEQELTPEGRGGQQPQSWEILLYLACHPAGVPKEKLIGALWQKGKPSKLSHRLNSALFRLRDLLNHQVPGLGDRLVRIDRNGICWLSPQGCISDAQQFLALYQEARRLSRAQAEAVYERARSLYAGDLLAGGNYRWLDELDDRGTTLVQSFRDQHKQITAELARIYSQSGEHSLAATLYREIVESDPLEVDAVHALYRCYQRLGDRASLMREHRHLRQALRQLMRTSEGSREDPELSEPDPATVALYEEILADLDTRSQGRPA